MEFTVLLREISPALKRIARSRNGHGFFIDENDLYQEMCIHLWCCFSQGMPEGINTAYVIKSCEFHILNYLRKKREKAIIVHLEEPVGRYGDTLKEILADTSIALDKLAERDLIIEELINNCFTQREKKVLSLLLDGMTVREIGKELGISHVMVVKVKNRIIKKWQEKNKGYQNRSIFT